MTAMNRNTFAKDLEEGLNAHFGMAYTARPDEWSMIFDTEGSDKAFEEDVLETGFGAAQVKPEGTAVGFDTGMQGWTSRYVHETIALAFAITEEAVEDNLYQRLGPKYSKALARAMKHTKEIKGAAILNNAFSASYPGGDGVSLLSTVHPLLNGGTFSNKLATPADLSEQAIEDLLVQIRKATDDRGIPISLMAEKLVLPPELEYDGIRLTRTTQRPGTADNDVNAMLSKGVFSADPAIITRLTDPDAWFILTDCPDGLKHMRRVAMKRGMQGDFDTGNMRYKARERYSFGWTDPRGCYGSEGAS
jgi:hypothetical protein